MIVLRVNGQERRLDVPADMPLLWALRDHLDLTGTKFGCGIGACGSCTVLVGGVAVRSCQTPVGSIGEAMVTTIEGVKGKIAKAVQGAWQKIDVVQCGYCQTGQVLSAIALLEKSPHPTDSEIEAAMDGNVCRCATYHRIRAAIHEAARSLKG
jgi:isoquinoline 1-oxidoreductase alpha subunit